MSEIHISAKMRADFESKIKTAELDKLIEDCTDAASLDEINAQHLERMVMVSAGAVGIVLGMAKTILKTKNIENSDRFRAMQMILRCTSELNRCIGAACKMGATMNLKSESAAAPKSLPPEFKG